MASSRMEDAVGDPFGSLELEDERGDLEQLMGP